MYLNYAEREQVRRSQPVFLLFDVCNNDSYVMRNMGLAGELALFFDIYGINKNFCAICAFCGTFNICVICLTKYYSLIL